METKRKKRNKEKRKKHKRKKHKKKEKILFFMNLK